MHVGLLIYDTLETRSGGYLYDRRLVQQLEGAGHKVSVFSLPLRTYGQLLQDNWRHDWQQPILDSGVDLLLEDELAHPSLISFNRTWRKRHKAPIVAIVHHLRSSEDHPALAMELYRRVERDYLGTVDAFIFNSDTTLDTVETLMGSKVRSIVAHPAGDHALHEAPRHVEQPDNKSLRLLFVGNIIPRKGLHTVIEAMSLANTPATLTVVGSKEIDRTYSQHVFEQVVRLGLSQRVRFAGSLSDEELASAYSNADLFVLPSYEGYGIVYLEAMACGVPVIASTVGAARELVDEDVNGYLVEPGDADAIAEYFDTLASHPERLAKMRIAARERYERHPTWEDSLTPAVLWLEDLAA